MNDVWACVLAARDPNWVNFLILLIPLAIVVAQWLFKVTRKAESETEEDAEELSSAEEHGQKIQVIREAIERYRAQALAKEAVVPPRLPDDSRIGRRAKPNGEREAVANPQRDVNALPGNPEAPKSDDGDSLTTQTTDVRSFLRNRGTVRAAVVAREVLSPPLSLRR